MIKKKHFATLVAVTLFSLFAVSCQPKDDDNEPEEATLSLSAQTLMMDNQAQTPSAPQITFQTNQSKVVVSAPSEWLEASVQGNGILIKAMANDLGRERKGEVLVFAGSAMDKITVTQSAADIVLEVSPDNRVVTNAGEEIFVSVKSNSDKWEVEPSTYDWIQVDKFTSELLKVTILPNETPETREGKLFAKLGTVTKQIDITQVGMGTSKFALPFLEHKPDPYELLNYEVKQGNYLMNFTPGGGFLAPKEDTYIFAYASAVFERVFYLIDPSRRAVKEITMLVVDDDAIKSPEFKSYLEKEGFKVNKTKENGSFEAENEDALFNLSVVVSSDPQTYSYLSFIPVVKQPQAYPAFTKFPYDKTDLMHNPAWTSAKIIEMEKAENATVEVSYSENFPSLINLIHCDLPSSSDREMPAVRLYFIGVDEEAGTTTDLATELMVAWKDYTLGSWIDGETFILTNEFKKLMTNSGFEFYTENKGNLFFYNKAKKLMIVPRGAKFTDLFDGTPVFAISYFNYEESANSLNDPILANIEIERLAKRVEAHNAVLLNRK